MHLNTTLIPLVVLKLNTIYEGEKYKGINIPTLQKICIHKLRRLQCTFKTRWLNYVTIN